MAGCGGGGSGGGGVHLHITPQGRHRYSLTKYTDKLLSSSQKYLMGETRLLFNFEEIILNMIQEINNICRALKASVNTRVFPGSPEFIRNFHHKVDIIKYSGPTFFDIRQFFYVLASPYVLFK